MANNFSTAVEFVEQLNSGSMTSAPGYPEKVFRTVTEHSEFDSDQQATMVVSYSGSTSQIIMDLRLADDKKFQIGEFKDERLTYGWTEKGYQSEIDACNSLKNLAVS